MEVDPLLKSKLDGARPHDSAHPHKKDEVPPVAPGKEPKTIMLVWAIVIIAVLLVAVLMIRSIWNPQPKAETITYNQYEFTQQQDGFWQFDWQRNSTIYHVPLRYNPTQLGNVTESGKLSRQFGNKGIVYVAVDPSTEFNQQYVGVAAAELSLNLLKSFEVNVVAGCTVNETESCQSRPIINCNTTDLSVVVVHEGPGPSLTYQGDCITVQATQFELIQAVDRLLYKFYGVMP